MKFSYTLLLAIMALTISLFWGTTSGKESGTTAKVEAATLSDNDAGLILPGPMNNGTGNHVIGGLLSLSGSMNNGTGNHVIGGLLSLSGPRKNGTGERKNCGCRGFFEPECGKDGNSYDNPCERECHGVEKEKDGACDGRFAKGWLLALLDKQENGTTPKN